MYDIQSLINMLQSNDPDKRYDACEQLRVSRPPLPQNAIDALQLVTSDANSDVADAAQRALALHASRSNVDVIKNEQTSSSKSMGCVYSILGFIVGTIVTAIIMAKSAESDGGVCFETCFMAILVTSPIVGLFVGILAGLFGLWEK